MKYEEPLSDYLSYEPTSANGDIFDGWYKDPECTESVDFETMPYNNLIVFGKWNPPAHKVTFDTNGGTMDATQTVFEGIQHGETVSGIADAVGEWLDSYKPVRENYVFAGWFDEDDQRFVPTQAIIAIPKNISISDNRPYGTILDNLPA